MKPWRLALFVAAGGGVVVGGGYWLISRSAMRYQVPAGARAFVIESEENFPTIKSGDVVTVRPVAENELKRGMMVTFLKPKRVPGAFRIAGLPGDRIELRHGVVVINGQESFKRSTGIEKRPRGFDLYLSIERFPGEEGAHRMSERAYDTMPEVTVSPNHLFLLGDNRSNTYDSRYMGSPYAIQVKPRMVSTFLVTGRVDGISMSPDGSRVGQPLDLPATATK